MKLDTNFEYSSKASQGQLALWQGLPHLMKATCHCQLSKAETRAAVRTPAAEEVCSGQT